MLSLGTCHEPRLYAAVNSPHTAALVVDALAVTLEAHL
jgi:hypothetical protein